VARGDPANLREWIEATFGSRGRQGLPGLLQREGWKRPLEELSADWAYTPGRPPLSLEDIVKAVAGLPTVATGSRPSSTTPAVAAS
jgi:protoporphyrinogen oxidase